MLRAFSFVVFLAISGLPVPAQQRLDGAAFDALTRGQTFYYGYGSVPYGAEEYLDNRRVRWSFLDGQCKDGYWYETIEQLICFVYEDRPDAPQCWAFFSENGRLRASFENGAEAPPLYQIERTSEPMLCLGPEVGV
jgi:hypothetical protein